MSGSEILRRIPKNTTLIGEINQFLHIPKDYPTQSGLIELRNGTVRSISLPGTWHPNPNPASRSYQASIA